MEGNYKDRYAFIGEWYDTQASLKRRFNVFFYPTDETVEMYDIQNRKMFVRRLKVVGLSLDNFYIGSSVRIFGRLVKIVDFACEDTRNKLQKVKEVTFVLIKPLDPKKVGKIFTHFYEQGLRIVKMKKFRLSTDDISFLFKEQIHDPTFPFLLDYLGNQLAIGLGLVGKNAIETTLKIIGDKDPSQAEPGTIRAMYGTDKVRNCVEVAKDAATATENLNYFFSSHIRLTATLSNCTLCIVKPHVVRSGKLGEILECIDEGGFNVTALNMIFVEAINASEFFEVYKGIVPEYKGMVEELASGPCVAMEIVTRQPGLNSAVEFRKLVGPSDPEIARLLRPHTLRAKFGKTKVQNAIHCSDLPADGLLEVEYFFKILDF